MTPAGASGSSGIRAYAAHSSSSGESRLAVRRPTAGCTGRHVRPSSLLVPGGPAADLASPAAAARRGSTVMSSSGRAGCGLGSSGPSQGRRSPAHRTVPVETFYQAYTLAKVARPLEIRTARMIPAPLCAEGTGWDSCRAGVGRPCRGRGQPLDRACDASKAPAGRAGPPSSSARVGAASGRVRLPRALRDPRYRDHCRPRRPGSRGRPRHRWPHQAASATTDPQPRQDRSSAI